MSLITLHIKLYAEIEAKRLLSVINNLFAFSLLKGNIRVIRV